MKVFKINNETLVAATSSADAIRVYCDQFGYKPFAQPDVYGDNGSWKDEDGKEYTWERVTLEQAYTAWAETHNGTEKWSDEDRADWLKSATSDGFDSLDAEALYDQEFGKAQSVQEYWIEQ